MRFVRYSLFLLSLCFLVPIAPAKDLRKKVGVGIDSQLSLASSGQPGPASLSFKYTLPAADKTINTQLQLLLGLGIVEQKTATVVAGGRVLYTVVAEDNCNVFVGVGGAYLRGDSVTSTTGIVRVQPLGGVEFFLFGLENLGFTASLGLNVDLGSPISFSTTGASFGNLGIHYYF